MFSMARLFATSFLVLSIHNVWAGGLPFLNIDPNRVVATGVSSGGIMAVQLGVAQSSTFRGIAVFAGGIYGCADKMISGSKNCLADPQDPKSYMEAYLAYKQSRNLIDPPVNIAKQRIYLFSGTEDKIVPVSTMRSLAKFYERLRPAPAVKFDIVKAGHGQPTLNPGNRCDSSRSPWLINCDFDGARVALEHIFGPLNPRVPAPPTNLMVFDQSLYATPAATMSKQGLIYIPQKCQKGATPCGLIVALHGCGQSPESIGPMYAMSAGYNEWAEANDFVVLYPAVHPGWIVNRAGCWDWWGYTSEKPTDQQAPQINAIMSMVRWLVGR